MFPVSRMLCAIDIRWDVDESQSLSGYVGDFPEWLQRYDVGKSKEKSGSDRSQSGWSALLMGRFCGSFELGRLVVKDGRDDIGGWSVGESYLGRLNMDPWQFNCMTWGKICRTASRRQFHLLVL